MVDAAINLTIGVAAGTENATASADVAVAVAECSSPCMAAFRLAASLCAALIVTHTLTVCYIGWRDLSGQWDKYALIKNRAEGTGLKLYVRGLCKFVFDILFMLLPALTVVCRVPGCGALVHLQSARHDAKTAGRITFTTGDGCGSRTCPLDLKIIRQKFSRRISSPRRGI